MRHLMHRINRLLVLMMISAGLVACQATPTPTVSPTPLMEVPATATTIQSTATVEPSPTATPIPHCYLSELPADVASSYAIQGWQAFAAPADIDLVYFYFPTGCPADSLEQDAHDLLYSGLVATDQVGLVILNPVDSGILGKFHQHLIQHEYWQMGPEDYPALLDDSTDAGRNLVFLRAEELNGDQTIIGNPLTVLTSLAEHEYIHVAQSRNNPDLAKMVWTDKDYQYFIEGYANIGNVSSQRYYFETQDAIVMLQNLDLMNRAGKLQSAVAAALEKEGSDVSTFLAANPPVYDRHIRAFFLRVGGQSYVDGLQQGEISPYSLFTRAGSGGLMAYQVLKAVLE